MGVQEIPFTRLKAKARDYLEELAAVVKKGRKGPFDTVIKDELDFAQFQIAVGLAIPTLKPEEATIIEGMCRQVERVLIQLETMAFRRKHPGS